MSLSTCGSGVRRPRPRRLALLAAVLLLAVGLRPAGAQGPAMSAKQFPAGYFYRYHQAPVKEKEQVLARLEATLQKLNREKLGLIAKGAVVETLGPGPKVYDRLTILDGSGLIIIARKVTNIYHNYAGPAPINPNIYIIIKNARVDVQESHIRPGFVVAGDFVAYALKFVTAIQADLEAAAAWEQEQRPPETKAK